MSEDCDHIWLYCFEAVKGELTHRIRFAEEGDAVYSIRDRDKGNRMRGPIKNKEDIVVEQCRKCGDFRDRLKRELMADVRKDGETPILY